MDEFDFDLIDPSDFDVWDDYYGQDEYELDVEVEAQRLNLPAEVPWGQDYPLHRIFGKPKVKDVDKALGKPEAWLKGREQKLTKDFDKQLDDCVAAIFIMGKEAGKAEAKAESYLHVPFTKGKNEKQVLTTKDVIKKMAGALHVCRLAYRDSLDANVRGAEYHGNAVKSMSETLTRLANERLKAIADLEAITESGESTQKSLESV